MSRGEALEILSHEAYFAVRRMVKDERNEAYGIFQRPASISSASWPADARPSHPCAGPGKRPAPE